MLRVKAVSALALTGELASAGERVE
jgi:hypothetical protein